MLVKYVKLSSHQIVVYIAPKNVNPKCSNYRMFNVVCIQTSHENHAWIRGLREEVQIRVEFCRHHVCYFSSATVNKESFCIEKILLHRLSAAHQSNAETMTFTRIVLSIRRKDFAILKYMHFIEEKSEHEEFFKNYSKNYKWMCEKTFFSHSLFKDNSCPQSFSNFSLGLSHFECNLVQWNDPCWKINEFFTIFTITHWEKGIDNVTSTSTDLQIPSLEHQTKMFWIFRMRAKIAA